MKPTRFYMEKEMLKLRIADQEQIVKHEIKKAIDPQKVVLKLIPDSIKKMFGFQKKGKPSFASLAANTGKIVENISAIVSIIKQFRSQMNAKN